jgi:hypothetical protein
MMVMMLLYVSQEGLASGGFSFLLLWMYGSVVVEQCACKKKKTMLLMPERLALYVLLYQH